MRHDPADVFFGPSADEIVGTRAAFGCTHYARAFIAVVKALEIISDPKDLRYVISSKADDYNRAMADQDFRATINGHQFVIVRFDSQWIAINTSKGESTPLPAGFDPDSCMPPHNIPMRFSAYPDVVFLLRRIGSDWDDGCGDNSRTALMNISRSGDPESSAFLWESFPLETPETLFPRPLGIGIGCALLVAGSVMLVSSGKAIVDAFRKGELLTTGVCRLSRNPLYSAWILFIFPGIGFILQWWLLFGASILAYVYFKLTIKKEREYVIKTFGQQYIYYERDVNCFVELLPWPRRYKR
jgi:protein-S-isoprenylcysteine O-methyltransferase Ste14